MLDIGPYLRFWLAAQYEFLLLCGLARPRRPVREYRLEIGPDGEVKFALLREGRY